jgi:hypothetical protein
MVVVLELHHVAVCPPHVVIEEFAVGLLGLQEGAEPHGPGVVHLLQGESPGVAAGVGRIVPGGVGPQRPVVELRPRIVGVAVGVEDVGDGEFARGEHHPPGAPPAGDLVLVVLDRVRGLPEAPGLPQEQAGEARLDLRAVHPVGLAVGRAGKAEHAAQALPAGELGVDVDLSPLPDAAPHEQGGGHRPPRLLAVLKAVAPLIGGVEGAVPLQLVGRLDVHRPVRRADRRRRRGIVGVGPGNVRRRQGQRG